jgi:hypothetical protein
MKVCSGSNFFGEDLVMAVVNTVMSQQALQRAWSSSGTSVTISFTRRALFHAVNASEFTGDVHTLLPYSLYNIYSKALLYSQRPSTA